MSVPSLGIRPLQRWTVYSPRHLIHRMKSCGWVPTINSPSLTHLELHAYSWHHLRFLVKPSRHFGLWSLVNVSKYVCLFNLTDSLVLNLNRLPPVLPDEHQDCRSSTYSFQLCLLVGRSTSSDIMSSSLDCNISQYLALVSQDSLGSPSGSFQLMQRLVDALWAFELWAL